MTKQTSIRTEIYQGVMRIVQEHRTKTGIGQIEDVIPYQVGDALYDLLDKVGLTKEVLSQLEDI